MEHAGPLHIHSNKHRELYCAQENTYKFGSFGEKGGEVKMELIKRLITEEEGQGLVEYTLIVLLVALVFWVAIKETKIGDQLSISWGSIKTCLSDPTGAGCTAGS
jgi:Flp pilus assembly pilin Flp